MQKYRCFKDLERNIKVVNKKEKLKKLIDDQKNGCIILFISMLIAASATIIWKTKIALFILSVTVILLVLAIIRTLINCCKLKKLLSAEKFKNERYASEESNEK